MGLLDCVPLRSVVLRCREPIDAAPFERSADQEGYKLVLLCLLEMKRDDSAIRTVVPSTCYEIDSLAVTNPAQADRDSPEPRTVHYFHWTEICQPTAR